MDRRPAAAAVESSDVNVCCERRRGNMAVRQRDPCRERERDDECREHKVPPWCAPQIAMRPSKMLTDALTSPCQHVAEVP